MNQKSKTMTKKAFNVTEEASRCLLCVDAPCTQAAPKGSDPARFVRAVRFNNDKVGLQAILNCDDSTLLSIQEACIHYDRPIRIARMAETLRKKYEREPSDLVDIDLAIDFCGIRCENPFFLSSSVIASNYEMCAKALSLGWAGLVFKTIGIFLPEEISPRFSAIGKEGTPFIGFRNLEQISDKPLKENLAILKRLKQDFPDKVIVASIMGNSEKEWTELARLVTEAGVDMIECNFSCPHMSGDGLGSDVGQNPELVRRYTQCTREGTLPSDSCKNDSQYRKYGIACLGCKRGWCRWNCCYQYHQESYRHSIADVLCPSFRPWKICGFRLLGQGDQTDCPAVHQRSGLSSNTLRYSLEWHGWCGNVAGWS